MSEYDKGWIKWLILGAAVGYGAGELVSFLLSLVNADSATFELLRGVIPALGIIVGLLAVLYVYNRKKRDD